MMHTWTRDRTASEEEHLPSAMGSHAKLTFRRQEVPSVRRFAAEFGARAGLASGQLSDFVLAVSEAAASAVSHGPATARLRLWNTGARVLCEIRGEGMLPAQSPGIASQTDTEKLRRGLLRQVCDHVCFESGPDGMTVRFSVTVV
jgi:anti-sigma regulatory factor (Ser/Thr protein kinase)